ncbi:hypothetical protein E2C01_009248 [Portunus trituberculatus]|uniref:Uncharacterized protein n=1 Tax=Portunus trituberculatus TaxID=210409 RepID=A0A5B7D5Q9_PORTR|nr:hypothetical protein [Portunus trituberculatus]
MTKVVEAVNELVNETKRASDSILSVQEEELEVKWEGEGDWGDASDPLGNLETIFCVEIVLAKGDACLGEAEPASSSFDSAESLAAMVELRVDKH